MRYRMNGFGWFAVLWIAMVSFALLLSGCGGGGHGSVIGEPASSHNQGEVQAQNFAWGECPPQYHPERCSLPDPVTGYYECDCVHN